MNPRRILHSIRIFRTATTDEDASARVVLKTEETLLKTFLRWEYLGWYAAACLGLWGAMIGIGEWFLADLFFSIGAILLITKLGAHFLKNKAHRKWSGFSLCSLLVSFVVVAEICFGHFKSGQIDRADQRLKQIDQIPGLTAQTSQIPQLRQQLADLKSANEKNSRDLAQKQSVIEGLARTVITQNDRMVKTSHQEFKKTTSFITDSIGTSEQVITARIDQVNESNLEAVAASAAPDRSLSATQIQIFKDLYQNDVCSIPVQKRMGDFQQEVFVFWVASYEASIYAGDFVKALGSGSCQYFGMRQAVNPVPELRTFRGIALGTVNWKNPTNLAVKTRNAFDSSHISYVLLNDPSAKAGVEILVLPK
jgi:hypothetical protein